MSTTTDNKMAPFTTAGAMSFMWQKAVRELHAHELEWFADGAAQQLSQETNALADMLNKLGCLVSCDDESGSFQSADGVANLLLNLSNQVSTLNGLADIAADASYRVRLALKGRP